MTTATKPKPTIDENVIELPDHWSSRNSAVFGVVLLAAFLTWIVYAILVWALLAPVTSGQFKVTLVIGTFFLWLWPLGRKLQKVRDGRGYYRSLYLLRNARRSPYYDS